MMHFFKIAVLLSFSQILLSSPIYLGKKTEFTYSEHLKAFDINKHWYGDGDYLSKLPMLPISHSLVIGIDVFGAWEVLYLVKSLDDINEILEKAYQGYGFDNFYTIGKNFKQSNIMTIDNIINIYPVKIGKIID